MNSERIREMFLGLIFVVLLIMMTLSFITVSAINDSSSNGNSNYNSGDNSINKGATITNSYNTYSNKNQETSRSFEIYDPYKYSKTTQVKYVYPKIDKTYKTYSKDYKHYKRYDREHNEFSSKGAYHDRYYGFFYNEVNDYNVFVRNNAHEGNYYTVNFYLTDYNGNTRTVSVSHYLKPHESKKFIYKNVFSDGKEYMHWDYKIIPYH